MCLIIAKYHLKEIKGTWEKALELLETLDLDLTHSRRSSEDEDS